MKLPKVDWLCCFLCLTAGGFGMAGGQWAQKRASELQLKEKDDLYAAREEAWLWAWDERQQWLESAILMDVNESLDLVEDVIANKCVGMLPISIHYDASMEGVSRFMAENDERWNDGVTFKRKAFPINIPITRCVDGEEKAEFQTIE